jgi:hypothetical protein
MELHFQYVRTTSTCGFMSFRRARSALAAVLAVLAWLKSDSRLHLGADPSIEYVASGSYPAP